MKRGIQMCLLLLVLLGGSFFSAAVMQTMADTQTEEFKSDGDSVIAQGSVTDTVGWKIIEDDTGERTLIIYGSGPMADYTKEAQQPWLEWRKTVRRLIVEDGVTRIGSYSMYRSEFDSVTIGADVESIGKAAFSYGHRLSHITIPGNVKKIEADAFCFHYGLSSVTLEEGVEELYDFCFGTSASQSSEVYIPASVKIIRGNPFWFASAYTVAPENPYFSAVDGMLCNKAGDTLVDFPNRRTDRVYRIPDQITKIENFALQRVRVEKLIIPSSIQSTPTSYIFRWSDFYEVYIEDGAQINMDSAFFACSKLIQARLPEDVTIKRIYNTFTYGCNAIESIKIPAGVQSLEYIGSDLNSLQELYYDAAEASIKDVVLMDANVAYELTVGEHVDSLPKEFYRLVGQASSIRIALNNQFDVEAGAFAGAKEPLASLEGSLYMDHQGVLYSYDEEEKTARIVYCQGDAAEIVIPEAISPEDGLFCQVIGVTPYAFKQASGVTKIVFEEPEQVVLVSAYAFAFCDTLCEINGQTGMETAATSFPLVESMGYRAFYKTGLTEADSGTGGLLAEAEYSSQIEVSKDGATGLCVTVQSEGETMTWTEEEDVPGYRLLTGDTLNIYAAVGYREGDENLRYRVYYQWDDETCSLSISPGQTYTFSDQTVVCVGTEDLNCVYMEFSPLAGKTLSIPVTAVYPSPASAGGSLRVWAVVLTQEEAQEQTGRLLAPSAGVIYAFWQVERDNFTFTRENISGSEAVLGGTQDGRIVPKKNLTWRTSFVRENETTSSYGQDYVREVIHRDILILPEGMSFEEDVRTAIQKGEIRRSGSGWYLGDRSIYSIYISGSQIRVSSYNLEWDEELDTAVFSYSVKNTLPTAQMGAYRIDYTLYADALDTDIDAVPEQENPLITHRMDTQVFYQHGTVTDYSTQVSKTVTVGNGALSVTCGTIETPSYFGDSVHYRVSTGNPGALPYRAETDGSWTLKYTLSPYAYLKTEDMEKMFAEDGEKILTITISKGESVPWMQETNLYGEMNYWTNGTNSGETLVETSAETLTIGWRQDGEGLYVESSGGYFEEETLEESLRMAGYAPGRFSEYMMSWRLNEETEAFVLTAGQQKMFYVYADVKETHLMLSEDWIGSYPTETTLTLTNTAVVVNENNTKKASASIYNKVKKEAYIRQYAAADGKMLKDGFTIEDGQCITYTMELAHYGQGGYENLPLVDDMYGAQALLVLAEKNPHLADCGLSLYEKEGESYYVLSEGFYENVAVGGSDGEQDYIASHILVRKSDGEESVTAGQETFTFSGLHTRIKWNCASLPTGIYRLFLRMEALVDQKFSGQNVYTIGNLFWMNDKVNSRLYAPLWGGGTVIDFEKDIVLTKGEDSETDVLAEEGYSLIGAGESVTYRLTLRSKGDGEYTVRGTDLADALPQNAKIFSWSQNVNTTLTYSSTHESTEVEYMDQWYISSSWEGEEEDGQQYLLWTEDMRITLKEAGARVYIYVTLTYPNLEEEGGVWKEYKKALGGELLENTFYVYHFPANVIHHLREPGKVLLQKGVYGTSYGSYGSCVETKGRRFYNSTDINTRQVNYYVILYNGEAKRLYLNDMYDVLPKGFTFQRLLCDSNLNPKSDADAVTTLTQYDGNNLVDIRKSSQLTEDVIFKSASVHWVDSGSLGRIYFGEGSGDDAVRYDEEKGLYYLDQNEAILFAYSCIAGEPAKTEDIATNTVFMNYVDTPKTGVNIVNDDEISFFGADTQLYTDQNDGTCTAVTGADILQQYGLLDGGKEEIWLLSDVEIEKGTILPGVTKYTDSYLPAGSTSVLTYKNAAGPFDEITWKVRLHNSGTKSITDYTLQDVLPSPYVLTGKIRYVSYDYQGREMYSYEVIDITERSADSILFINNNTSYLLPTDGTEQVIKVSGSGNGTISCTLNEEGEEVISIRFTDRRCSVPEGGYTDVYFSAVNPTTNYKNTVYTNQAFLTPHNQTFHSAGQGSLLRDETGNPVSVTNSAPLTVTFGYATESEKTVAEKTDIEGITGESEILLSSCDSIFTYYLSLANDTEKPMDQLILIDNLPEPGDSSPFDKNASRNSEFTVSLCENPNFCVKITTEDGEDFYLEEEAFIVEYENKGVFEEGDWDGSTVWEGSQEDARSIRIRIEDETGERIPARSKVTVSFDCCISGETEAGQQAFNSFGYHYSLLGLHQELESMPLPVKIQVPYIPVLVKCMQDSNGGELLLKEAQDFTFLLYEGEKILLTDGEERNLETLIQYLEREQIPYLLQEINIPAGKSCSEAVLLSEFSWKEGESYTIEELDPVKGYEFYSVNGRKEQPYTFTYLPEEALVLEVVNTYLEWSLEIHKTDASDETLRLAGAIFAIYGREKTDVACQKGETVNWSEASWEESPEEIIEKNGQTWYLLDVRKTDETGNIIWNGLTEESYYLLEAEAPDGYTRNKDGLMVYTRNVENGVLTLNITNAKGVELPQTGGQGILPCILTGGGMIFAANRMSGLSKRKRGHK